MSAMTVVAGLAVLLLFQGPPRDPRPDMPRPASQREVELKRATAADPSNVTNWIEMAGLQEKRGAYVEAEQSLKSAIAAGGETIALLTTLSDFYNRLGRFEPTMEALERAAALAPGDPRGHQLVAVYYYDKASKDLRLAAAQRARYTDAGIAAADRALAIDATFADAMVYKNLLLRVKAGLETDQARRDSLLADADALRNRALELQKRAGGADAPGTGLQPVRVGGNIKAPTKLVDVRPVYPPAALEQRVSGMVILEALIDVDGSVRSAKVLRSIPLLDDAAIEAVKGWRYTPTLLNGVAVPVLMTVTVNFTVQ